MKRALWSLGFALFLSGTGHAAQGEVEIVQRPIQCWPTDRFLMLRSEFVPPGDIQTAKFYFRKTDDPDYYYVEFTLGNSGGSAIAPMAEPTTESVTFYSELVTRSFTAFRSEEKVVPVATGSECQRRDPETAFYNGQNPDIAVGATRAGAAPLPPGFQAQGISKFLNATGIVGQPGGGLSGKTIGIIAGVGAGAGGALAFTGSSGSETTTTGPFGGTTSSVSTSSTSTAIGGEARAPRPLPEEARRAPPRPRSQEEARRRRPLRAPVRRPARRPRPARPRAPRHRPRLARPRVPRHRPRPVRPLRRRRALPPVRRRRPRRLRPLRRRRALPPVRRRRPQPLQRLRPQPVPQRRRAALNSRLARPVRPPLTGTHSSAIPS